jgi:hypothetical protein
MSGVIALDVACPAAAQAIDKPEKPPGCATTTRLWFGLKAWTDTLSSSRL